MQSIHGGEPGVHGGNAIEYWLACRSIMPIEPRVPRNIAPSLWWLVIAASALAIIATMISAVSAGWSALDRQRRSERAAQHARQVIAGARESMRKTRTRLDQLTSNLSTIDARIGSANRLQADMQADIDRGRAIRKLERLRDEQIDRDGWGPGRTPSIRIDEACLTSALCK